MVQWELLTSTVLILIQLKNGLLEQELTNTHFLHHQLHLKLRKKNKIDILCSDDYVSCSEEYFWSVLAEI